MIDADKAFDDAREMFLTDGWKTLMEDLQQSLDNITVESLDDEKGFWVAKGQISVLRSILGYQNMMEASEESDYDESYT